VVWFSVLALALAFGAQEMSAATVTYIVGTCTSGTQFSTIQSALDASPAANTIEVCPRTYFEQVTISHPKASRRAMDPWRKSSFHPVTR
jgi:pectin methylesterase-like acyl-CoA thioesterase